VRAGWCGDAWSPSCACWAPVPAALVPVQGQARTNNLRLSDDRVRSCTPHLHTRPTSEAREARLHAQNWASSTRLPALPQLGFSTTTSGFLGRGLGFRVMLRGSWVLWPARFVSFIRYFTIMLVETRNTVTRSCCVRFYELVLGFGKRNWVYFRNVGGNATGGSTTACDRYTLQRCYRSGPIASAANAHRATRPSHCRLHGYKHVFCAFVLRSLALCQVRDRVKRSPFKLDK